MNSPLQQRSMTLDLDFSRANQFPQDYETNLDFEWASLDLFADGDDFSWNTIEKNRNLYYQKQQAKRIYDQMIQTIATLTSVLIEHLNLQQNFTINQAEVSMFLQKMSFESLRNGQHHFPSKFDSTLKENQIILYRVSYDSR